MTSTIKSGDNSVSEGSLSSSIYHSSFQGTSFLEAIHDRYFHHSKDYTWEPMLDPKHSDGTDRYTHTTKWYNMIRGSDIVTRVTVCVRAELKTDTIILIIELDWTVPYYSSEDGKLTVKVFVPFTHGVEGSMAIAAKQGLKLPPLNIEGLKLGSGSPDGTLGHKIRDTTEEAGRTWHEILTMQKVDPKWGRHPALLKMLEPIRNLLGDDLPALCADLVSI